MIFITANKLHDHILLRVQNIIYRLVEFDDYAIHNDCSRIIILP